MVKLVVYDPKMIESDCKIYLKNTLETFDLTFLDPPFNQGKGDQS